MPIRHPAKRYTRARRWGLSLLIIGSLVGVNPLTAAALELEDEGAEVEALQQQLQSVGIYDGPITGFYGELTQAAVEEFQRTHGLAVDGVAGSATQATLTNLIQSASGQGAGAGSLTEGDSGPNVAELQTLLREAGYYGGPISGVFGTQTLEAVETFQAAQGLAVDGLAGSQTITALRNAPIPTGGTEVAIAPAAPTPDPNLIQAGESSDRVVALQERLIVLGHYSGSADGIFGDNTAAAVRDFQASRGLTVDGVAGPATRQAIGDAVLELARSGQTATTTTTATAPSATPVATAPAATNPVPIAPPPGMEGAPSIQPSTTPTVTVPTTPIPTLSSQPTAPTMPLPTGMPTATPPEFPAATPPMTTAPPSGNVPTEYSVIQLQRQLQEMDLYQGSLDGQVGTETNQAIEAAQDEYGVSPADFATP